ncbi:MAG: HAD family phosphatase [Gloeomargaritaceae cyanobacterium C42_A2020_066]|nr:HAD family phosphatase [Gloeomargaritaceae cyanobacterium C42_A2020_066]
MIRGLLFDLDGTLTHTDALHYQVWQSLLADSGVDLDPVTYRQQFSGRCNEAILAQFYPHLSPAERVTFGAAKEARFRQLAAGRLQPLAGLVELLALACQRQWRLALVTNAPRENAHFMLDELGLRPAFEVVILGEELPAGKPDPLPYCLALEKLGLMSAEALAFEDSPTGIRSALGAGVQTVGLATTHRPADLAALGATPVITDFTDTELAGLLELKGKT